MTNSDDGVPNSGTEPDSIMVRTMRRRKSSAGSETLVAVLADMAEAR